MTARDRFSTLAGKRPRTARMGIFPFLALARRLGRDYPAYLTQMRILPQSQWARLVGGRLAGDYGVPDAWCRMKFLFHPKFFSLMNK